MIGRGKKKQDNITDSVFSDFFRESVFPCYVKDAELKYLAVSDSFVAYLRKTSPDEFIGKTDHDIFGDDKICKIHEELDKKVLAGEEVVKDHVVPMTIGIAGKTNYTRVTKVPVKDKNGNIIGVMGTAEDCTMAYEAEMRFKKQVTNYLRLPNNSLCCAFIDVTDWKMLAFAALVDGQIKNMEMSVDEFITKADRTISVDINEHRYFANLYKDNILRQFNEGLTNVTTEFFVNTEARPSTLVSFEYFFLVNPKDQHVCIILSVVDKSAQRKEKESQIEEAEQDLMTGVLNHDSAINKIALMIQNSKPDQLNALFVIDVDNFQSLNDQFGQRTGDNVLAEIAEKIRDCMRENDIVGRMEGDKFIVYMPDLDRTLAANQKANELISALQYECQRNGKSVYMTSSLGAVVFKGADTKFEDICFEADSALYQAKHMGKNRAVFSEDEDVAAIGLEAQVSDVSINVQTVLNGINGLMVIAEVRDDELFIVYSSNSKYDQKSIEFMPAKDYNTLLYAIKKAYESKQDGFDYVAAASHVYLGKPRWIRVQGNFVESDRPDTIKMLALVTDVYEFKNTEQLLQIENTKFDLALSISNTITWEYDAGTRRIELHDSNSKPIPYIDDDMCFPDTKERYVKMYEDIDKGVSEGTSFVHFKSFFGKNLWMQVSYKTTYNESGHVIGALFAAHDVSNFIKLVDRYDSAKNSYMKGLQNDRPVFHVDITNDKLIEMQLGSEFFPADKEITTATDFFDYFMGMIDCPSETIPALQEFFSFETFEDSLNGGVENIDEEFFIRLQGGDSEWYLLRLFLATNPQTRNNEVFGLLKNVNSEHISSMIIDRIFDFEYEFLAVIDTKRSKIKILQDRSNRINAKSAEFSDYEDALYTELQDYVVKSEEMNVAHDMSLHNLKKCLNNKKVHSIQASVLETAEDSSELLIKRKRYLYTYLDDSKRYIAMTKSDITDQYKTEFDPISGLCTRTAFCTRARDLIDSNPRKTFVIVRWDIDNFKLYNDLFGTAEGDAILATIGNMYRDNMSDILVGNLGGDNFALCMESNKFKKQEQLEYIANMLSVISENYKLTFHMAAYKVTDTSLDISVICDRTVLAVKSIKSTDTRFVWYEDSMRDAAVKEQDLISEIRAALVNGEFTFYVQPQFNQMTMELVSGESLIRWIKPDGTMVPPGEFVPLMEKTGLITRADQIIWEQTCAFLSKRKHEKKKTVPIAVNISRKDFFNPNLVDVIIELTKRYNIDPELLDLEVTESAYIENKDVIFDTIKKFQSHGFKVKMDDFGAGYSSLNTLKHVPVDMIKLDMDFLSFNANDESAAFRSGVILDSVIRMAHWLGLPVIAEGVETAKQAEFLKTIDCAIVQGYFFSKPLPQDEFEALLDSAKIGKVKSLFNVSENFDNYDFWNPDNQTSLLFNTFIGSAGIIEYYKERLQALRLNTNFYNELRLPADAIDFTKQDLFDIMCKDDHDKVRKLLEKAGTSSQEFVIECRFLPALPTKQKYIWLRLKLRRLAHTDLRSVFYVSVENITRRKLLEAKNTGLAKLLSTVIDSSHSGLFTYELGDTLKIKTYSNRLAMLYGYTEAEYIEEFGKDPLAGFHPGDQAMLLSLLKNPFPKGITTIRHVCRHLCKDGSYKKIVLTISKAVNIAGTMTGYFVISDPNAEL